jgi:hypothetical protein
MAQSTDKIIEAFKKKDLVFIINHSALPFNLEVASEEDSSKIISKSILEKKLKKLFNENYFDDMLRGKKTTNTNSKITIESKSFDKQGELESESTITFYFKKIKGGNILLYKIIVAG